MLAAKSDHEVMQLKPGTSRAAIKKKYREMTLALHPDKCKVGCSPPLLACLCNESEDICRTAEDAPSINRACYLEEVVFRAFCGNAEVLENLCFSGEGCVLYLKIEQKIYM